MALTEKQEVSIYIQPDGVLNARVDRIIMDGTDEIGRKITRIVYTPDMDITALPAKVRKFANIVWDQATIDVYKAAHPPGATI